jgi:hypothetical protein
MVHSGVHQRHFEGEHSVMLDVWMPVYACCRCFRNVVRQAFNLWSRQIGIPSLRTISLEFEEARTIDQSDINIMWAEGQIFTCAPLIRMRAPKIREHIIEGN